jgi:hypothetical protein
VGSGAIGGEGKAGVPRIWDSSKGSSIPSGSKSTDKDVKPKTTTMPLTFSDGSRIPLGRGPWRHQGGPDPDIPQLGGEAAVKAARELGLPMGNMKKVAEDFMEKTDKYAEPKDAKGGRAKMFDMGHVPRGVYDTWEDKYFAEGLPWDKGWVDPSWDSTTGTSVITPASASFLTDKYGESAGRTQGAIPSPTDRDAKVDLRNLPSAEPMVPLPPLPQSYDVGRAQKMSLSGSALPSYTPDSLPPRPTIQGPSPATSSGRSASGVPGDIRDAGYTRQHPSSIPSPDVPPVRSLPMRQPSAAQRRGEDRMAPTNLPPSPYARNMQFDGASYQRPASPEARSLPSEASLSPLFTPPSTRQEGAGAPADLAPSLRLPEETPSMPMSDGKSERDLQVEMILDKLESNPSELLPFHHQFLKDEYGEDVYYELMRRAYSKRTQSLPVPGSIPPLPTGIGPNLPPPPLNSIPSLPGLEPNLPPPPRMLNLPPRPRPMNVPPLPR